MAPGESPLKGWVYWCTLYGEEVDGMPWSPRLSLRLQREEVDGTRMLFSVSVPLSDLVLLRRVERARLRGGGESPGTVRVIGRTDRWYLPSEGLALVSTLALLQRWTPSALHILDTMRPSAFVDALRDVGAVP